MRRVIGARSARLAALVVTCAGSTARAQSAPGSCHPVADVPPARPPAWPVDSVPYDPSRGMDGAPDLGIGTVRPVAGEAAGSHAWYVEVEFPAFRKPGEAFAGSVSNGWWIPAAGEAGPRRISSRPMVEIGYEVPGWVVVEVRDGWVRIRLAEPGEGSGDGTVWTSRCHLAASEPRLEFAPWEEVVGSPLFFRGKRSRDLRAGPGEEFDRLLRVPGDDREAMVERLEVRGDWMRVRVTRPSTYCVVPPPPGVRVDEGWIRWRDDETGPRIWWFTRGC